jgi:hypothetical protein
MDMALKPEEKARVTEKHIRLKVNQLGLKCWPLRRSYWHILYCSFYNGVPKPQTVSSDGTAYTPFKQNTVVCYIRAFARSSL